MSFLDIDLSYPGIEIKYELILMNAYIEGIRPGIEHASNEYVVNNLKGVADDDYFETQDVYNIAAGAFERFVMQPFVVSISALFENAMIRLLSYAKEKEGQGLSLKDITARSPIQSYQKYLKHVLHYSFSFTDEEVMILSDMIKIRNCVAHANGNPNFLSPEKLNELKSVDSRRAGVTVSIGSVDIDETYLKATLKSVEIALRRLMDLIEHKYHTPLPPVPPHLKRPKPKLDG